MSLLHPVSDEASPAPHILAVRDWLEVVWIHTSAVSAQMIEIEAVQDRPN